MALYFLLAILHRAIKIFLLLYIVSANCFELYVDPTSFIIASFIIPTTTVLQGYSSNNLAHKLVYTK